MVTTSGTLVTLIFAIAQFLPRSKVVVRVPGASRWLLAIAVAAFVVAAVGGLLANIPRVMGRPRLSDELVKSRWSEPTAAAEKSVAFARAHQLKELESANDGAARAVVGGLAAAVLAIAMAAAAVIVAIFTV